MAIWEQILGIGHIGIRDNFFTLGGHSLLATQVISRLRDEFGVEVPLQQIFETPTIADLASVVTTAQAENTPLPKIEPLPRWRHRAKVSALGEPVFSKELKALLDRFAANDIERILRRKHNERDTANRKPGDKAHRRGWG